MPASPSPSPDRTAAFAEALDLAQADLFWAPPWVRRVERPGLAYLACGEDRRPWNTVWATPPEAAGLPGLVAEVGRAHREVTSRWLVTGRSPPSLVPLLRAAGYTPSGGAHAWIRPVAQPLAGSPGPWSVRRVGSAGELAAFFGVAETAFGMPWAEGDRDRAWELGLCTGPDSRLRRYLVVDDQGRAVASGALRVHPALGLGYLLGGATLPEARGRGAYDALLRARLDDARRLGLAAVGLYAQDDTSGPIVARRGFVRHQPMSYWTRPPPS